MAYERHCPDGLERRQLERLEEYVQRGHLMEPEFLLRSAYSHLEDMQQLRAEHQDIAVELAEAICRVLDRIVTDWDSFSPVEQSWLRGMMWYFAKSNDELHDHLRGGFRDDLEVLNACLRYVRREEWLLPVHDADT
jgi:hypothetical protein